MNSLLFALFSSSIFAGIALDNGTITVTDGANQTIRHACNEHSALIEGANNKVRLLGFCPTVFISGANNHVNVDQTTRVIIDGAQNRLTWHQKHNKNAPKVMISGAGNTVFYHNKE